MIRPTTLLAITTDRMDTLISSAVLEALILHTESDKIMEMVLGKSGSVVRLQVIPGDGKDPSKRRVITLVRREVRLTEGEAQAQLIERPMTDG
jgi:C-terminal processing protease CtpA/Prc